MMKKLLAMILAAILVASLCACGSDSVDSGETKDLKSQGGKTLIVYFSWSNNTDKMAGYVHDIVGGDIERIEPSEAYPEDYDATADLAKAQRDNNERPSFNALSLNPEDYDVIFIGYPIWWYELPMIMRTFFDTYDLSGKIIVPFNTHEGSGNSGTYDQIRELEPKAEVLKGLAIRGGKIADSRGEVESWLKAFGY